VFEKKKKKDNTVPFFYVSKKKTMARQHAIIFFYGGVPINKAIATCYHPLLLWWCSGLIWWFLDVYTIQGTTKEEFVANAIQVEMQCCDLYTICYTTRAINIVASY
jgi:hypothetical protein